MFELRSLKNDVLGEGWIENVGLVEGDYYMEDGQEQGPTVQPREPYSVSYDKP